MKKILSNGRVRKKTLLRGQVGRFDGSVGWVLRV